MLNKILLIQFRSGERFTILGTKKRSISIFVFKTLFKAPFGRVNKRQ